MKRMTGSVLVLAAMVAAAAGDLAAQPVPVGRRGPQMAGRGAGIEAIMRMRDQLELTDAQVATLDGLRRSNVERRSAEQAFAAELRSRLAAGQVDRDEFTEQMRERRDASRSVADQSRSEVEAVLTDAQRGELEQLRGRARAFAAGRASAMRGNQGAGRRAPGLKRGTPQGRRRGPGAMPGRPGALRGARRGGGFGPGDLARRPGGPFDRADLRGGGLSAPRGPGS